MKLSAYRRAQRSSSGSPISSIDSCTSRSASGSGSALYSAMSHSRGRAAASRMAATPSGPTSRSTNGISAFVKIQPISAATITAPDLPRRRRRPPSPRLVHERRRDVDGVGDRVAHRRLAVDRLLALPDLLLGRGALHGHRVPDVAEPVAHRLVVAHDAAEIDVRLHVEVDGVHGNVE